MQIKKIARLFVKTMASPKLGAALMIGAAAYQLATAVNSLMTENKRIGFRKED